MKKFTVIGSSHTIIGTVEVEEVRDEDVIDPGSLYTSAVAYGITTRTPGESATRELAVKAAQQKFGHFRCIGDEVS